MIRATFTPLPGTVIAAATVDTAGRTIGGVAVPWNVDGLVSDGRRVRFEPASLDPAARPIALRDHDRSRPIGRVVDAADTGTAMLATVRASRVPDGDHALVLAADGALPAFSVGAEPTAWHFDGDVLVVEAADWHELSLLTFGAYAGATVTDVTATQPERPDTMITTAPPAPAPTDPLGAILASNPEPTVPDPDDPTPDDPPTDPPPSPSSSLAVPAPVLVTAAGAPRPAAAAHDISIRGINELLRAVRAGTVTRERATGILRGVAQRDAMLVQAALTNVTLVGANNVNFGRPAYAIELVELISWGRPTIEAISRGELQRGDYPSKAFAQWVTPPTVGLQVAEKDPVTSTAVKIGPASAPVMTWAGANDISQQTVDFGPEGFVDDYIQAAAADYARKSNTYAVTQLLAMATAVGSPAADASFVANMAALFGGLNPALVPASALILGMSWDLYVKQIGTTFDEKPAFWDGTISFGRYQPNASYGGLTAYCDPMAPAGSMWLGPVDGVRWYEFPGSPASLQVRDVNLLGLDVGVYGYGAFGVRYPGSFVKLGAFVP